MAGSCSAGAAACEVNIASVESRVRGAGPSRELCQIARSEAVDQTSPAPTPTVSRSHESTGAPEEYPIACRLASVECGPAHVSVIFNGWKMASCKKSL